MRETQLMHVYRMLMKGATTNDFGDVRRLRNNWRARKTKIRKMIKAMGGEVTKRLVSKPGESKVFYYIIQMYEEGDRRDPLGWLTKLAEKQQDLQLEIQESGPGACQFCGHWTKAPTVRTCDACFEVTSRLEIFLAHDQARKHVRQVVDRITGGSKDGEVGEHRSDQQSDGTVPG